MIKRLLTSFAALALCYTIGAQGLKSGGVISDQNLYSSRSESPAKAQAQIMFTYYTGDRIFTLGEEAAAAYDCAIFVPSEYAGMQIYKIGILLTDSTIVKAPKAWISSTLPASAESADGMCTDITDPVSFNTGYNYISPASPYTIPEGGCYVGYSFYVDDASEFEGKYPVLTAATSEPAVNGGHFLRASLSVQEWTNMYGSGFSNLATQVFISGNFPDDNASVGATLNGRGWAIKGEGGHVSMTVRGTGTSPVSSLDYTVTNTGKGTSYDMHANLDDNTVAFGEVKDVNIPVKAEEESGTAKIQITVNKVNGTAIPDKGNLSATGSLMTLASRVKKMVVMEEFTATGCGYCPRGITGMRMLKEHYPESFIGIAVHDKMGKTDPMKISAYNTVLANYSAGLPSATLNRTATIDPYYGSDITGTMPFYIENDYKALLETPAECAVDVTAAWGDADYTKLNVKTDITFQYNGTSAPFSIGYVVVEDSLTGNTSGWYQSNYLSGDRGLMTEPNLSEWVSMPSSIKDIAYDHVAIAATGISTGLKNIIKTPFAEGVAQTHEYTIDLTGNKVLQDKRKLKIVAIIFNTNTKEVVNADEKAIAYDGPTGICKPSATTDKAVETARYTIDGRRTTGTAKGLSIVRMSDGSVRKITTK